MPTQYANSPLWSATAISIGNNVGTDIIKTASGLSAYNPLQKYKKNRKCAKKLTKFVRITYFLYLCSGVVISAPL